jgi:hypothetical protein
MGSFQFWINVFGQWMFLRVYAGQKWKVQINRRGQDILTIWYKDSCYTGSLQSFSFSSNYFTFVSSQPFIRFSHSLILDKEDEKFLSLQRRCYQRGQCWCFAKG